MPAQLSHRVTRARFGQADWRVELGDFVATLESSPDGALLVAGSLAGDALLLDAAHGTLIANLAAHPFGVLTAAWSNDGARFVVGGHDGIARIYGRDGIELGVVDAGGWVARLRWSPVVDTLAIGAGRNLITTDESGNAQRHYDDVASTVADVVWSVDGRRVGVAAYGGISWYEPHSEPGSTEPVRHYPWKGSILALALSPNGKWACAGAQDASIHIWKLWSADELSMSGYPAKIERVAFAPDSRWMASACLGELSVWDFGGKGPRGTAPASGEAHDRHIEALGWSPDGTTIATGGDDGRLILWPSPHKQRQTMTPLDVDSSSSGVSRLAWHPSGSMIHVGHNDGTVETRSIGS